MLSFTILVLADLSGLPRQDRPRLRLRRVIPVNAGSYAQIRARLYPENSPDRTDVGASWVGLKHLVDAVRALPLITVKIWDISKLELFRDLRNCSEVDQSLFFKRVCEDELGTLGDEACGLLVGDFDLSGHPDDVELARKVQAVAAMAEAPFLCGVSADPDWRAVWESDHNDLLFCLSPRNSKGGVHPAYLVAASVAGAMNADGLESLARNLLPAWLPEPASMIQGPGALESPLPAGRGENLARQLLTGCVYHELKHLVRLERSSDSASALDRSIRDWVRKSVPRDAGGNPLFALEHIEVSKDLLVIALSWHQVAGGGLKRVRLQVPGLLEDRPPAADPA